MASYTTEKYGDLILGKEIAAGGEGTVYQTQGHPELAIKLYKDEHINTFTENKIKAMVQRSADLSLPVNNGKDRFIFTSWPLDLVRDDNGRFCGFVMRRFENTHSIICACRKSERVKFIPRYRYSDSVILAMNLANEVAYLHSLGIIIGDMNWKNIGFTARREVILFDADSFTFRGDDGKLYKTKGGFSGLLPPELLGRNLAKEDAPFTKESDNFQLAILIWCLLMDSYHPFGSDSSLQKERPSSSSPSIDRNIARGNCPCVNGQEQRMAEGCPSYQQRIYDAEVRKGFEKTFLYDSTNALNKDSIARRTTAHEWAHLMKKFLDEVSIKDPTLTDIRVHIQKPAPDQGMKSYPVNDVDHATGAAYLFDLIGFYLLGLILLICFNYATRDAILFGFLDLYGWDMVLSYERECLWIVIAAGISTLPNLWLKDRDLPLFLLIPLFLTVLIGSYFMTVMIAAAI